MQYGNYALDFQGGDPYNPLGLPPFTIRCKFAPGFTPTAGDIQTLVDAEENIWDIYKNSTNWRNLLYTRTWLIQVYGANTTGVIHMDGLFRGCEALMDVALFDTRACTNMRGMFCECSHLKHIPLFDTSSCNDMTDMCFNCSWVQSGALALYQQASSQSNPPRNHHYAFHRCGRYTVTGAAELAQIPDDWK